MDSKKEQQTIGVAVVVLNKDKSHVLLGKRLNAYKSGWLGLPGGRVDPGEPLINCCRRELLEETGIQAKQIDYLGVVRDFQKTYDFIHFAFLCSEYDGEPQVMEPEKCESWDWYSLDKLPNRILPAHRAYIEFYKNRGSSKSKSTSQLKEIL